MSELPPTTWVAGAQGSGFGLEHLPYGVIEDHGRPRLGVAIGDRVLDLAAASDALAQDEPLLHAATLNPLLAAGPAHWARIRASVTRWLSDPTAERLLAHHLLPRHEQVMRMPFEIGDYVDFYASEHHARTVGSIFRPDGEALTPNWKHLPIGYHGRSGTVVVSGTPITRPSGQSGPGRFGPSRRLDLEAEVGFVVGMPSVLGEKVALQSFRDHVFGVCLVNDWSARDHQAFEYVPLGPFLGKSFGTSMSPWITPLAALSQSWVPAPDRDVPLLPYLDDSGRADGLDVRLRVELNGTTISEPPVSAMYWTGAQMLAHLTVNGANLRTGDLYASGTVSGAEPDQRGALIELTWNGERPISLEDGSTRGYLQDGDEVVISGTAAGAGGALVRLGEVRGRIAPARR